MGNRCKSCTMPLLWGWRNPQCATGHPNERKDWPGRRGGRRYLSQNISFDDVFALRVTVRKIESRNRESLAVSACGLPSGCLREVPFFHEWKADGHRIQIVLGENVDNLQTYTARQERKKYEKEAFDEKPSVKLCNGSVHGSVTGCLRSSRRDNCSRDRDGCRNRDWNCCREWDNSDRGRNLRRDRKQRRSHRKPGDRNHQPAGRNQHFDTAGFLRKIQLQQHYLCKPVLPGCRQQYAAVFPGQLWDFRGWLRIKYDIPNW